MAYTLKQVTIRTNNTDEGMKKIDEIWKDISSGKLPILFDSEHGFQQGVSPISKYSNYESDENGDYDLSIVGVKADFFQMIETEVSKGLYKEYDEADENGDIGRCAKKHGKKCGTTVNLALLQGHILRLMKAACLLNIQKTERHIATYISQ